MKSFVTPGQYLRRSRYASNVNQEKGATPFGEIGQHTLDGEESLNESEERGIARRTFEAHEEPDEDEEIQPQYCSNEGREEECCSDDEAD